MDTTEAKSPGNGKLGRPAGRTESIQHNAERDKLLAQHGERWAKEDAAVSATLEETRTLMGDNDWKHGISANRKELELVMGYTYEQGLVKHPIRVEDVSHVSTMELKEA